ncbi:hypothetical protein CIW54_19275 [Paraburkholderia sp. T12-10]|nr:hypothetical protein CIW54_19275 [Paraburkholderia sp. T12-10]
MCAMSATSSMMTVTRCAALDMRYRGRVENIPWENLRAADAGRRGIALSADPLLRVGGAGGRLP